jgi:transcriptional regulator with XRE-family HTH domain
METPLATTIGGRTRSARVKLGLTQADAAERIGISTEFYARIERGGTMPSVPTLAKIAAALETSADELLELAGAGEYTHASRGTSPRLVLESAEMRRLLRRLRGAAPETLRLLALVAKAIATPQRYRQTKSSRGHRRRRA